MRRASWSWRIGAVVGVSAMALGVLPADAGLDHGGVVSADPVDWTPDVEDGKVRAVATVGDITVAVGDFSTVSQSGSATSIPRQDIFAFDSAGRISSTFRPQIDGREVFDVVPAGDGKSVYIGGQFRNVDGVPRTGKVARIDVTTGEVDTSFRPPRFNRKVTSLHRANGRLYVGGWFSVVGGSPRTAMAALDESTGADSGNLDLLFSDTWNGGIVGVDKFTMTPDGSRLVAVGNFRKVDGQSRPQVVMVDTEGSSASLHPWATSRFSYSCHPKFKTYMYDVDSSPDGSYFVIVTTGAFSGGVNSGTLCDTASRWEFDGSGPGQQPTWVDYMGGDTVTAVEVTDAAVYIGGHFRWANNPYRGDRVGPGAIKRQGLAALDPRNGLPLSWNPTRRRGWGVWGFRSTPDGLWLGHDTDVVAKEPRRRLALMPAVAGSVLAADNTGSLPGDAYLLGRRPTSATPSPVLYRVNAGGPEISSLDGLMNWARDDSTSPSPHHNAGSSLSVWTQPIGRSASVPATTPQALFSSERWDPSAAPEMSWDFPTDAGVPLRVRLYFSNGFSGTRSPGQRVFDVRIDGQTVLDDFDIAKDVGHETGTVKSFDLMSDGNVDLDFVHVTENPLINGIEIVRTDVATPSTEDTAVLRRGLSEAGPTGSEPVDAGVDWTSVRGAFMVDGRLYTGWADGRLTWTAFNGRRFGNVRPVNLRGLTAFASELAGVRAMWFDRDLGRIYYTLNGQPELFYRYFTPESRVVGAVRFQVPASSGGVDWRAVTGAFLANGRLYFSTTDGTLSSVSWNGGPGSVTQALSGPTTDGVDWSAKALFLYAG